MPQKLYFWEDKNRTTEDKTPYRALRLVPSANPAEALQQAMDDGEVTAAQVHKIIHTGAPLEANPSKNREARRLAAQKLYDQKAAYMKARGLTDADILEVLKRRPS